MKELTEHRNFKLAVPSLISVNEELTWFETSAKDSLLICRESDFVMSDMEVTVDVHEIASLLCTGMDLG